MTTAMQHPTLTNVHIRSASDAHKLFYAVQLGLLPKIDKRLDANERAALRPGDVYVWEEKGPNSDSFSVSMERFTEGKSWTASRVREVRRPVPPRYFRVCLSACRPPGFPHVFRKPPQGQGQRQVRRATPEDLAWIVMEPSLPRAQSGLPKTRSSALGNKTCILS